MLIIKTLFLTCEMWVNVTGYGNMLARPLFREKHKPDMGEDDAMQLMKEALKVLCHLPLHETAVSSEPCEVACSETHPWLSAGTECIRWYQSAWYIGSMMLTQLHSL